MPCLCSLTTPHPHGLSIFLKLGDQCITLLNYICVLLILIICAICLDDTVDTVDGACDTV